MIRIYYSRHIDFSVAGTTEIPGDHIDATSLDEIRRDVEIRPGTPRVSTISFRLQNLVQRGIENYPPGWFTNQYLPANEGAVYRNQLFWKIEQGDNQFVGIQEGGPEYEVNRSFVKVNVKHYLSVIKSGTQNLLGTFQFNNCTVTYLDNDDANNPVENVTGMPLPRLDSFALPDRPAKSINGEDIIYRPLDIRIRQYTGVNFRPPGWYATVEESDAEFAKWYKHGGWDVEVDQAADGSENLAYQRLRTMYIKIGDITLLARVKEYYYSKGFWVNGSDPGGSYDIWGIIIYEANNASDGIIENVFERGRFFNNNKPLVDGDKYSIEIYDYNLGYDTIPIRTTQFPETASIFAGCFYEIQNDGADFVQLIDTPDAEFDIVDLIVGRANAMFRPLTSNDVPIQVIIDELPSDHRKMYWSDISMFPMYKMKVSDALKQVSTAVNAFIYVDAGGDIIIKSRNSTVPPVALDIEKLFEVTGAKYFEGYDTFSSTYNDRIEVSNTIGPDEDFTVDAEGTNHLAGRKNLSVEIEIYRGPGTDLSASYPGVVLRTAPVSINDYIKDAVQQLVDLIQFYSYPQETTEYQYDNSDYPDLDLTDEVSIAGKEYVIKSIQDDYYRKTKTVRLLEVSQ